MGRSTSLLSLLTAATLLLTTASATLDPIVIKGSKFFYKTNGTQFFIKGVAYQSGVGPSGSTSSSSTTSDSTGYVDPLADETTCARDVPLLQALGTNTIRTYAIDPTQDHSKCMALLDAAGIYVISDLGEPNLSINREDPQWTTDLYSRYTAVIDALSQYSNTIGYFAGNEVSNNASYTEASAFVKAAVRDSKAYIKSKGYTAGVGYAADDDATMRANVAAYFNCGPVADQIDFWGYNIYEWCGDSNYEESGYADRVAEFTGYSVPAFFAEYGCNTQGGGAAGRKFTEVAALYGANMSDVFSGGFVYEYFQEQNDYGLATVVNDNTVSTLADYGAFSSQIHAVSPTPVNMASYTPTNTVGQSCPSLQATWAVQSTALPPTPNADVCECMVQSLVCVPSNSINVTDLGTLFGQVCGYNGGKPCAGIARNATSGTFGAYSMCNSTQQLANAFNSYYLSQNSAADACDFAGAAQIVKAVGAASSCGSLIASATASNAGGATGTGAAASSSTKKSEASVIFGPSFDLGKGFAVGFTILAAFSGALMILL